MTPASAKRQRRPRPQDSGEPGRRGGAFTLVELLVVVAIISVLAGTLIPSVSSVRKYVYVMRTQARIAELDAGCRQYYVENRYRYPGQTNYSVLMTAVARNDPNYSGSQILASCMFDIPLPAIVQGGLTGTMNPALPRPRYASVTPEDLRLLPTWSTGLPARTLYGSAVPYTISDRFPAPRAICYYPCQPNAGPGMDMYGATIKAESGVWNLVYTEANEPGYVRPAWFDGGPYTNNKSSWPWECYILNPVFCEPNYRADESFPVGSTVVHPGEFLLIAPGIDRSYGNKDDDITNFQTAR